MTDRDCGVSECFFCQACNAEWLELTRLKKKTLLFKRGEQLFTEGGSVLGMYFILYGAVKIHMEWGMQKDLIIRFATKGDMLGARSIGDTTYRISATALETTEVCFIPNEHLQASLRINAELTYKFMQFYASELQKTEQRMNDWAHLDVKGRVAKTLIMLNDVYGPDKNKFIDVTVSRQDIASYAGTTYETIFKLFAEWTTEKIIKTEGKRIKIINEKRLLTTLL
jgi:CRP/FNR family transcriptional regulator